MLHTELTPVVFGSAFEGARRSSSLIAEYTSPWADGPGRHLLATDALSGCVVRPDGEVCLLWSLVPGRGEELVAAAVEAGGTRLDCFDGYLPSLYARHGFVETHREPNWTPGGPDVVYMSRV